MKRLFLFCVCLAVPFFIHAQEKQLELRQRWSMNEQLMDLVEMYERYAGMERNSDIYSFSSLFRSDNVPVWCDYISSSDFGKNLPVSEYVKYSRDLEYRDVKVKNLKKGDYQFINGRWHVPVEFDKQFKYEDSQFLFSTLYPELGGDFHIVVDCVWIEEDNCFRIAGISGTENPASTMPKGRFSIVQQKNEIDRNLLYKGKPISFNDDGFAIVPDTNGIEFRDDDVQIKTKQTPGEGRYDIVSFSMVPTRWRARTHFSLYPSGAYAVTAENGVESSSNGWEAGEELGYAFSLGKSTKLVFYGGLSFASSSIALTSGSVDYQYELTDASGDVYNRKYHINGANDGINMSDMVISGCVSLEQNFGRRITGVLEGGVKVYLNTDTWIEQYTISGEVEDLSGKHTLPSSPEYYFYPFDPEKSVNQFSWSGFVKTGLEFAPFSSLYIFAHAGYEFGISDSVVPFERHDWFGSNSGIYPLVYIEGRGDVAYRSLLNTVSWRRNGLFVEAGLRIKFGFKK